ncbi:prepilin-type N-terminal cleavage/methylation domain-containing protein [Actinoplanes sp. DH11]|uniref:prepilin-type N-terminal cleavage/methylation domain-containing protein n=1 Tax=Actinoplanes sp. DH11 TaxID=2857011 RepID=UPI001E43A654|nr:prepilin-type N-terminal cleavage/methylation domain-containing protein [Actinoplanes sp. DH11]
MQDVIAKLRAKKNDEGFTLIELLVVVVIIGVLVAIAVPVYLNYRQGAADKSAQSDVRGAISAVEQFYTNNGNAYPATKAEVSGTATTLTLTGASGGAAGAATGTDATITLSDKTKLGYVNSGDGTYKICALNDGGSPKKYYLYDSKTGGSVKTMTGTVKFETCTV